MNPDLAATVPQPDGQPASLTVVPLHTITKPMPNTKIDDHVYFVCTVPSASMFRQDGKKLPFVQGYLKTNIKEDIAYLDKEIGEGNIYVRRATEKEIEAARMFEDPLGFIKDTVRVQVEKEVRDNFTIAELEKLLADKKKSATEIKTANAAPTETPEEKAKRLLATLGKGGLRDIGASQSGKLNPASTAATADAAQRSDSK